MTPQQAAQQKNRWTTTFAAIGLTVLVAVLFFIPLPFFETIHGKLYDAAFYIRGTVAAPSDIVIVAVDDNALLHVGRWPWPRNVCAALIDRLSQSGAKIIALDIVFLPDTAESDAFETQTLKEAVSRAGNVVLPFYFEFGKTESVTSQNDRDAAIASQAYLLFDDPKKFADYPPPAASNLFAPALDLAKSAKALGHINVMADPDGTVRRAPLIIKYGAAYYPSFSAQVVASAWDLTRGDITVRVGESVRLGKSSIPTDARAMALVNYYGGAGSVRHYSAADVLEGKTADAFRDKIVFVGITAAGLSAGVQDLMATPFDGRFPGVEKHAQETAAILQGRMLTRPAWASFMEFGLLLAVGLALAFLLPVFSPLIRLMVVAVIVLGLGGLSIVAFSSGVWLKIFFPVLLALLLYAATAFITPRTAPAQNVPKADSTIPLQPDADDAAAAAGPDTAGPPQKIGRYDILGELGQGAMGVVYKGKDPIINRLVAIKTILFDRLYEASEISTMKARFFKEAEAAGKLTHPNIVTIFDVGDEKGLSFIAMEYVEGKDLSQVAAEDGPLPWRQACAVIIDAAEALDFAHRQGVVHRDVKPANIMLATDGRIKVMDFGIAKIASSTLTQAGAVMGTPAYMSPELINATGVDGRSDIFSLGVVLYELLTGAKPFKGENIAALWRKILETPAAQATTVNPDLPRVLDDILNRALAKSPGERYQTGKQMADALRDVINCQLVHRGQ